MDEGFFTTEQMERRFPGVHDAITRFIVSRCTEWPDGVPKDFDHIFLRELGLPAGSDCCCGPDERHPHYTLLQEPGGWRVHNVRELVNAHMEALR